MRQEKGSVLSRRFFSLALSRRLAALINPSQQIDKKMPGLPYECESKNSREREEQVVTMKIRRPEHSPHLIFERWNAVFLSVRLTIDHRSIAVNRS